MDFLASLSGGDCWGGLSRRAQMLRLNINGVVGLLVDGMVCFCKRHTSRRIYERVASTPAFLISSGDNVDIVFARSVHARKPDEGKEIEYHFSDFQRLQSISVGVVRAVAFGGWQSTVFPGTSVTTVPVAVLDALDIKYELHALPDDLQQLFLNVLLGVEPRSEDVRTTTGNPRNIRMLERVAAHYHALKCQRAQKTNVA
jgi:hypothetical protein